MEPWEEFWNDVVEFIKVDYNQELPPSQWTESIIQDFLIYQKEVVNALLEQNPVLAEVYGTSNWGTVSAGTFRLIFDKKTTKGNPSTRNGFALYMGFRSAEHYLSVKREGKFSGTGQYRKQRLMNKKEEEAVPVTIQLPDADFAKEDKVNKWMLYEVAFLWFGKEPPSIQAHFYQMTREMEQVKASLHKAVELGFLEAETKVFTDGITRFLTRDGLVKYVREQKLELPEFLNVMLRA